MIASEPMLPAIIGPVLMPMPMSSSATRPAACQRAFSSAELVDHLQRRLDRVVGVLGIVERRAEQRHHHVADELVERALVPEHDLDHPREVLVQHADDLFRLPAAR